MVVAKFLGIEIGGTKIQLSVFDASGITEQNIRYKVNLNGGAEHIQTQIAEGLERLHNFTDIAAIGVGFGGPVDWKTGTVRVSHQVGGWNDFNLAEWLQHLTQKPVVIENDANVAALAEAVYGAGKGYESVFYMTIGSGIGGGMIVQENIYHGCTPGETEIGHLRMNKEGTTLESICSGWAVNKKVKNYINKNPATLLAQMAEKIDMPESALLQPAVEKNNVDAKRIIEEIADDLSFALSHVVHLFHPDIIVIGGGLSLLKEHLRLPVVARLPLYIMKAFLPLPPVQIAALGESAVPAGAAELAKKHLQQLKNNTF